VCRCTEIIDAVCFCGFYIKSEIGFYHKVEIELPGVEPWIPDTTTDMLSTEARPQLPGNCARKLKPIFRGTPTSDEERCKTILPNFTSETVHTNFAGAESDS
jgi:hypothetical protein